MANAKMTSQRNRDAILKLMSDAEVAKVSNAETASSLPHGGEYFDLEDLGRGVQKATGEPITMGHIVPRTALSGETWNKIVAQLSP